MLRSMATVTLGGTLDAKLKAIARAGFEGVEIFENDLIQYSGPPEQIRRMISELNLTLELYQPFRDMEGVPQKQFEDNLARVETTFDVMERLGATKLLLCSNVSEFAIDDDALVAAQLHRGATLAARRGFTLCYEALAWGRHVRHFQHAYDLVLAADHPNLGICLDSFHTLSLGDDPAGIAKLRGDKIFFVQIADAPWMQMDLLQWSRKYRCFPGQGSFDLKTFVSNVRKAGYRGALSLEIFNDLLLKAPLDEVAVEAMQSLMQLDLQ